MAKKSKFIKNLLTTASALAVIAGGASSAFGAGAATWTTNNNATAKDGGAVANADRNPLGAPPVANFAPGDIFTFGGAHSLTADGNLTISKVDVANNPADPALITGAHVMTISEVSGVAANAANARIDNSGKLVLDGGDKYSKLGNINFAGATGTLSVSNGVKLLGAIDNTSGTANQGDVVFDQGAEVTGNVGATKAVKSITIGDTGQGTVQLKGTTIKSQVINLKNDSTFKIGTAGNDTTVTTENGLQNTSGTNHQGILEIDGVPAAANSFIGDIGANNENGAINSIQFNDNSGLIVTGSGIWAKELKSKDGTVKGALVITSKADGVFTLSANTQDNGLDALIVSDGAAAETKLTIKGVQKYSDVDLDGTGNKKHEVILSENSTLEATTAFTFNDADQVLELKKGSTLRANDVVGDGNDKGIVKVSGDSTIDATDGLGVAGTIKTLKFGTEDVTLSTNAKAINANAGIDFEKDATLKLTNDNVNITITSAVLANNAGTATDTGFGTISSEKLGSGKTFKIVGNIGDAASTNKRLKELAVTGGAKIELEGTNLALDKINIGSTDNTIKLGDGNALDLYVGQLSGSNGLGTVEFNTTGNNTIKLREGTNIGAAGDKRKNIKINGNTTVTVEDNVELHAGGGTSLGGIVNTAAAASRFVFEGSAIIGAAIGQENSRFDQIKITGTTTVADSKKTVEFLSDVNVANEIILHQGTTAIFRGDNIRGKSIIGDKNGVGTVVFGNENATNIDIEVGDAIAANELKSVELNGGNVKFNQNVSAGNLEFTSENALTATFTTNGNLENMNFVTGQGADEDSRKHNIVLESSAFTVNALTLKGSVGTKDNQFGYVQVNRDTTSGAANNTLTIENANFYGDVTTNINANNVNGKDVGNNLVFKATNGVVRNIGEADKQFLGTTFKGNTTVMGNAWSANQTVDANVTVNYEGDVVSSNDAAKLETNNQSVLNFKKDGAVVDIDIDGAVANNGMINFEKGVDVKKSIKDVNQINFGANNSEEVKVAKDLSANSISFKKSNFKAGDSNLTFTGASSFENTSIDVSSRTLTLAGGNSEIKGDARLGVAIASNNTSGKIVSGNGSMLNLGGLTKLNIDITDNSLLPTEDASYKLFKTEGNGQITNMGANAVVEATDNNRNNFVLWTFNKGTNELTRTNNAVNRIKDIVAGQNQASQSLNSDIAAIADKRNTGDAESFTNDLSVMRKADGTTDNAKITEAVKRLTTPVTSGVQVSNDIFRAGTTVVNDRMASVGAVGVAAGDEHLMYGVWARPFYNRADQDSRSGTPGYDATSYGLTVGADAQVNADLTIGAAFTYSDTDVKHKGTLSGDKTKGDTYMFSIYGMQQLTNEWFMQGNATFSSSSFKTSQKRLTSGANQTAKGKFDTTVFGGELLFGYDFKSNDMVLTPMFGAAYSRHNDGGYTEKGTKFQNLRVKKKSTNVLDVIAGGKVQFATMNTSDMDVTPEVHGFVRHDLLGRDEAVDIKLNGTVGNISAKKSKNNHTYFTTGGSLMAKQGEYEFGVGYDATFASKYIGHQGSLKIRLNF